MPTQYWACRPIDTPEHTRVSPEKTDDPKKAIEYCFGRGVWGYEAMPLGTRIEAVRSRRQFIAKIEGPGWIRFEPPWKRRTER